MIKTNKIVVLAHALNRPQNFRRNESDILVKISELGCKNKKIITSSLEKCHALEELLHFNLSAYQQGSTHFNSLKSFSVEDDCDQFAGRIKKGLEEHELVIAIYHQKISELMGKLLDRNFEDAKIKKEHIFILDMEKRIIIFSSNKKSFCNVT